MSKTITINNTKLAVVERNNKAYVNSRDIATVFEKQHSHIIRKIEGQSFFDELINQSVYGRVDYTDKKGESRKSYDMDRDGFLMVTLTLRGKIAERYRLDFIKAFNKLEEFYINSKINNTQLLETDVDFVNREIISFDSKHTISVVNGKPRRKFVRGYYRSINGKVNPKLDKEIHELKMSYGGVFAEKEITYLLAEQKAFEAYTKYKEIEKQLQIEDNFNEDDFEI